MSRGPIRWVGSRALLIEHDTLDEVLALHAWLTDHPLPGQVDLVPAMTTLLVKCESHWHAACAHAALPAINPPPVAPDSGRTVEIEVVYDGEDLETVGELTGLGAAGLIEAHTHQHWRAAFNGFAPGFSYLAATGQWPDIPRRDSPRTVVPAGSVALAGQFSTVYPQRSPGGWQLIGRSKARLWDLERDPPALIQPGDLVRYKAVERLREEPATARAAETASEATAAAGQAIAIIHPGLQSLVEDLGRPALSHLGLPVSGGVDETAARQANRLAGNTPEAALIETLAGGLTIQARGDLVLARSGAEGGAEITGGQSPRRAPQRAPFALHDGETLAFKAPDRGLRSYLAVRGGIEIAAILGSRATDTMSGIGPAALAGGTVLPVGAPGPAHIVGATEPTPLAQPKDGITTLRMILGPHADWFSAATIERFCRQYWHATEQSNRIGVRLMYDANDNEAGRLERCRGGELATEGMLPGAVQVPPEGLPIIFLKDHPVTGGYPVIAVVIAEDLPRAAQIAPGEALRFVAVAPDTLRPLAADADPTATPKTLPCKKS